MKKSGAHKIHKASYGLMILIGGTIFLSLLQNSFMASYFGASSILDAFIIGNSIPYVLINWFVYGALSMILIPVINDYRLKKSQEALSASNSFINLLMLGAFVLSLVCIVFAPAIISALGRGMDSEAKIIAAQILRILMLVFSIAVIGGILNAILRTYEFFYTPAIARCLELSCVIITIILLSKRLGIFSIVTGVILGLAVSLGFQLSRTSRRMFPYRFEIRWREGRVKELRERLYYFCLIGISSQVMYLVDRYFASLLYEGSVAVYQFATRFEVLVVSVIPFAITIPLYTRMSSYIITNDQENLVGSILGGVKHIALFIFPFLCFLITLRIPIIQLWLQYDQFTFEDTIRVSRLLLFLSPALFSVAFSQLIVHTFFAMNDSRTLKIFARLILVQLTMNVILDSVLIRYLGLTGLALAASMVKLPTAVAAWILITKKIPGLTLRTSGLFFLKISLASVLTAFALGLWVHFFYAQPSAEPVLGRGLFVSATFLGGSFAYIGLCSVFRVSEVGEIQKRFLKKLRKRNDTPES